MTDSSSDYSSSDNEDNFRDGGAKSHTYTSNYTSQMFVSAKNKETDLRKNEVEESGTIKRHGESDNDDDAFDRLVENFPSDTRTDTSTHFEESKLNEMRSHVDTIDPSSLNLGVWERHTRGIGSKLLTKFGFSGRLGIRGDGIAKPVEVMLRPQSVGLGFGDFKEKAAAGSTKSAQSVPKNERSSKSKLEEAARNTKSWKQGAGKRKRRNIFIDEEWLGRDEGGSLSTSKVIDMRSSDTAVISEMGDISKRSKSISCEVGSEMLYNLHFLVQDSRMHLLGLKNQATLEARRKKELNDHIALSLSQESAEVLKFEKIKKLQKMLLHLQKVFFLDPSSAGKRETLIETFKKLPLEFGDEYKVFQLDSVLKGLINRTFASESAKSPRLQGSLSNFVQTVMDWAPFLAHFVSIDDLNSTVSAIKKAFQEWFLRDVLNFFNTWDPSMVRDGLDVFNSVKIVFPSTATEQVSKNIVGCLRSYISSWTLGGMSLEDCIKPWINPLGNKISALFTDIRKSVGRLSSSLDHSSIMQLMLPWLGIFDESSLKKFVARFAIPKFVLHIRRLEPRDYVSALKEFISYRKSMPLVHLSSVLEGEFFPRWLFVLFTLLTSNCNISEIYSWYHDWKMCIPAVLLAEKGILRHFEVALRMIESHLDGNLSFFNSFSFETSYEAAYEVQQDTESEDKSTFDGTSHALSLRDTIAEFASENGLDFSPQFGKTHDGKQIWTFNDHACLISNDTLLVQVFKGSQVKWIPATVRELCESVFDAK